jgi:hypothetical protein
LAPARSTICGRSTLAGTVTGPTATRYERPLAGGSGLALGFSM